MLCCNYLMLKCRIHDWCQSGVMKLLVLLVKIVAILDDELKEMEFGKMNVFVRQKL